MKSFKTVRCFLKIILIAVFLLLALPNKAITAQSISLLNGETVYALYSKYGGERNLESFRTSFMLHGIRLKNSSKNSVTVKSCSVTSFAKNRPVEKIFYDSKRLSNEARHGKKLAADKTSLSAKKSFFKGPFANNARLAAFESLLISNQYFDIYSALKPDSITIECDTESGKTRSSFRLLEYNTKNRYIVPMKGQIGIFGGPHDIWGHRIYPDGEFAFDLIVLHNSNSPFKRDPFNLEDHHCYGWNILAPAEGKIVDVLDGLPDNSIPYDRKLVSRHFERFGKVFSNEHIRGGNRIIIKHNNSEFSKLSHLRANSIKVKKGDHVKQGDKIAACGNSGTGSSFPHLHFQLMDSPDPAIARGLPVRFENVENRIFFDDAVSKMEIPDYFRKVLRYSGITIIKTK